jgi:integrase
VWSASNGFDALSFRPEFAIRTPRRREPLLRLELSESERQAFLTAFDDRKAFGRALDGKRLAHPVAQSPHFTTARRFGGDRLPESPAADDYFARFQWLKPLFVIALETGLRKGDLLALRWDTVNRLALAFHPPTRDATGPAYRRVVFRSSFSVFFALPTWARPAWQSCTSSSVRAVIFIP